MNDKIAKTMLGLCIGYLSVFYVLKFFFPELLIQVITSPTLLRLGEFVNSWIGFEIIIGLIYGFITLYLFACAGSGKFKLSKVNILIIVALSIINFLVSTFLPEIYTHTSIVIMFVASYISKGKFSYTVISFAIHGYLSQFLLSIRGFETMIIKISELGALSVFVLGMEMFVWLILLSIIFYLKENKYELCSAPLPQQEC